MFLRPLTRHALFGVAAFTGGTSLTNVSLAAAGPEPCEKRICNDKKNFFASAMNMKGGSKGSGGGGETKAPVKTEVPASDDAPWSDSLCPPDVQDLGRGSWTFLHSLAAYYPDSPTPEQIKDMDQFMQIWSRVYPCEYCAEHMRMWMAEHPPQTESQKSFSRWMCELHNEVNVRLGKSPFPCGNVDVRWRDGPDDGSCDWTADNEE